MSDIITDQIATAEHCESLGLDLDALRSLGPSIEALVKETRRAALLEAAEHAKALRGEPGCYGLDDTDDANSPTNARNSGWFDALDAMERWLRAMAEEESGE